jgi:hypothetical protein
MLEGVALLLASDSPFFWEATGIHLGPSEPDYRAGSRT